MSVVTSFSYPKLNKVFFFPILFSHGSSENRNLEDAHFATNGEGIKGNETFQENKY